MLHKLAVLSAWLLPRICVSCGFNSYNLKLDLCADCKQHLPWIDTRCYQCGAQITKPSESIVCEKCQSSPPPFNRLCALFKYKPPVIRLIGSLKFGRQLYPAQVFGHLLTEAIMQRWYVQQPLPQLIIPVPLHEKRHRQRGYNQATEISLPIAKTLHIPLGLDVCERVRYTKAQAKLNRAYRTRNLTAAFKAKISSKYKSVALVDDVVTTGSTVRAVSMALIAAGVENIEVWCVCRG
jgi:ComF family protein